MSPRKPAPVRVDCRECGAPFVTDEGYVLCLECRDYDEWVKQNHLPPGEGK